MKIEKLTENKIRIILKSEDIKDKTINLRQLLILATPASKNLFLEILDKAEKEVSFDTNGCRLLIETYFQGDDVCIFTITKYIEEEFNAKKNNTKKYLKIKKKPQTLSKNSFIYQFDDFEDFCDFCNFIDKSKRIELRGLFKKSLLYNYNNTYYLVIGGINTSHTSLSYFLSSILEFSTLLKYNVAFEFKLTEHGKLFIKNNAIYKVIKYFS